LVRFMKKMQSDKIFKLTLGFYNYDFKDDAINMWILMN